MWSEHATTTPRILQYRQAACCDEVFFHCLRSCAQNTRATRHDATPTKNRHTHSKRCNDTTNPHTSSPAVTRSHSVDLCPVRTPMLRKNSRSHFFAFIFNATLPSRGRRGCHRCRGRRGSSGSLLLRRRDRGELLLLRERGRGRKRRHEAGWTAKETGVKEKRARRIRGALGLDTARCCGWSTSRWLDK